MPGALLFDMNGVVIDDMRFHEQAWIDLAVAHGRALEVTEVRERLSGRTNPEILEILFGPLPADRATRLGDEKEAAYRRVYAPHLAPVPGLLELLDAARVGGAVTALVTSAPQANIDFTLDGLSLRSRFDAIVTGAEVTRGKPDPEIYLLAARRLGVPPPACVVLEDSLAGITSGRRAGMTVVGLSTTHAAAELSGCALVRADFRGLDLATLDTLLPPGSTASS
jgi:HAD superfamily hydrolase (TIGR01509 family)